MGFAGHLIWDYAVTFGGIKHMTIKNKHVSEETVIIINKIYAHIPKALKNRYKSIFELKPRGWILKWDRYWDYAVVENWFSVPQQIEEKLNKYKTGYILDLHESDARKYDGDYESIGSGFLLIEGVGLFVFNDDGGVCEIK